MIATKEPKKVRRAGNRPSCPGRRAEGRPSAAPLESLDLAGLFAGCRWRQQVDEKLSKKTVTVPAGVTVT